MTNLKEKITFYLRKNRELLDDFYLLRLRLCLKKEINENSCTNLENIINEIKFIIYEQSHDCENVLEIYNFLKILQKTNEKNKILEIRRYLNSYLDTLIQGLVVNEKYYNIINSVKDFEKISPHNIIFGDVKEKRKKIEKKLVLVHTSQNSVKEDAL